MTTAVASHIGDIGTVFELTILDQDEVVVDVSSATTKEILFQRPNEGTTDAHPAVFTTDGTDGKIRYVTQAGDLDVAGAWQQQGHVILTGSATFHTNKLPFTVEDNL